MECRGVIVKLNFKRFFGVAYMYIFFYRSLKKRFYESLNILILCTVYDHIPFVYIFISPTWIFVAFFSEGERTKSEKRKRDSLPLAEYIEYTLPARRRE